MISPLLQVLDSRSLLNQRLSDIEMKRRQINQIVFIVKIQNCGFYLLVNDHVAAIKFDDEVLKD